MFESRSRKDKSEHFWLASLIVTQFSVISLIWIKHSQANHD